VRESLIFSVIMSKLDSIQPANLHWSDGLPFQIILPYADFLSKIKNPQENSRKNNESVTRTHECRAINPI
jgi:hypothetical protein